VALPAFGRSPEPRLAAAAVALFLGRRPSPGEGEALGRRALSLHDAVTEVLRSAEFVGRVLDPLARGEALPHGARPGPLFAEAAALLRPFFPAAGAEALCRAVAGEARGTLTALLAERGLREAVFPAVGADPALRHARRLLDGLGRDGPGGPRILSADVLPDGRVETVVAGTPPGGPLSARCEIDDGTGTVVETGLTPAAEGEDRFRVRFRLPAALCDGRTRYAVLRLAAPGWPAPPALPLALSAGDANLAREHDRLLKLLRRALRQASEGPRDAAAALLDEMAASAFAPEDTGLVRALLLLRDGRRGEAGLALAAVDRAEVREPAVFRLGAGLALALGRPAEALAWYGSAARRRLPPTACDLLLAAFAESVLLAPQAPPAGRAGVLPGDAAAAFPAISRLLRRALGGESVEDHALIEAGAAQPRDVAALAVPALVGVLADEAVVERFLAMLARGGVLTPGEAAAALASNGLLDLAVPTLARLAPEHFGSAGLLVRLGKARQRAGDDDETSAAALAFAERALALAPGDEDALALAASLNRRLRRPEAALPLFRELHERRPGDLAVLERLAALERDALAREPTRGRADLARWLGALREGRLRALLAAPGGPAARYEFARALILTEDLGAARSILEDLLAEDPGHLRAARDLLRVAQLEADPADVADAATRLLTLERSDDAVVALVKALRQEERFDEAEALLARHADLESPRIAREQVRNLFFLARSRRPPPAARPASTGTRTTWNSGC
jgi:tetratricopeptide (TPR) repeat protein